MAQRPPQFFTVPRDARPSRCRSCQAPIYWIKTDNGKTMPVDCNVEGGFAPIGGAVGHPGKGVSHFATCEFAAQHRKRA